MFAPLTVFLTLTLQMRVRICLRVEDRRVYAPGTFGTPSPSSPSELFHGNNPANIIKWKGVSTQFRGIQGS